jgi:diguanylate cyclase (GGDEF)-like protein
MKRRTLVQVVGFVIFAHSATVFTLPNSPGVSLLFPLACCLSAAVACYLRSTGSSGAIRRKWDFLASAQALWGIGVAIYALRICAPSLGRISALGPEFYFLIYGIPVLLAISTSNEDRDTALFVVIDSLQAIFAVVLVYIELLLSQVRTETPAGPANLTLIYGFGGWMLAGAALLRVLARPSGEEKALYRILLVYLCFFAFLATPWHGRSVFTTLPLGIYRDLLADVAFLLQTAGCLLYFPEPEAEGASIETNSFALMLNNSSPILFPLAVLALGAMIARRHLVLGMSAIGLSLLTYCFRAALLQSAYIRAQHALTRSQFALREANVQLRQLSLHDALTGLPNRRQFDLTLEREWSRAIRNSRPLSLLLIDVDCFKALNDLYGHPVGDDCLQRVAGALEGSLRRAAETVARYGGEEFAAVLPDADADSAHLVAETMRQNVLGLQVLHEGSVVEKFVTISVGVATAHSDAEGSPATLIVAADAALYRAKKRGRNRTEVEEASLTCASSPG